MIPRMVGAFLPNFGRMRSKEPAVLVVHVNYSVIPCIYQRPQVFNLFVPRGWDIQKACALLNWRQNQSDKRINACKDLKTSLSLST